MFVSRLQCTDFRNYATLDWAVPLGHVVVMGANGQGKTNLAEMIQFLATGKSHRTTLDRRMIRFEHESLRVTAHFRRGDLGECSLTTVLSRDGQRRLELNGAARPTQSDVLGYLNCALFSALDVDLIGGDPANRRRHLNEELAKAYPRYYDDLAAYRRALAQRNRLLRDAQGERCLPPHALGFTHQFARTGGRVLERRLRYVSELKPMVEEAYGRVAGTEGVLKLRYATTTPGLGEGGEVESTEALLRALAEAEAEELRRGMTLVGPHRDDLSFSLQGKDLRRYGSRGQQKTAAIALRLAEALRSARADEPPVLILDDIMSELDRSRRERLVAELDPFDQVIAIGTTESDFVPELLERASRYTVDAGTVTAG